MICHSDCQYLHHSLLPAIIVFLSQSDENFYHHRHQKNVRTILANLPVFEIVYSASIVLHYHCCAALSCTATPVVTCVVSMKYCVSLRVRKMLK